MNFKSGDKVVWKSSSTGIIIFGTLLSKRCDSSFWWTGLSGDMLDKQEFSHVKRFTLEEVWNSPLMRALREK